MDKGYQKDEGYVKVRCRLWEPPKPNLKTFNVICGCNLNCTVIIGPLDPVGNCKDGVIYIDWVRYVLVNKKFVEKI